MVPMQKAVVVEKINSPLVLTTRPIPVPKEGEILIRVIIAGLNPHDTYAQKLGLFIQKTLPTPMGIDLVGIVEELGAGVPTSAFSKGDKIFSMGETSIPDQTGTQEYAIVRSKYCAKVPENLTDDEVATFPVNSTTGYVAVFVQGFKFPIPPDASGQLAEAFDYKSQQVVIIGGGSACGKFAIQWLKHVGVGTIITVASKKNEQELKRVGATDVVERHQSDDQIDEAVRLITGDSLIYVLDCVNASPHGLTLGARLLSNTKRGVLATLVATAGADESKIGPKHAGWERRQIFAQVSSMPVEAATYWRNIRKWIDGRVITPTSFATMDGLDAAAINDWFDAYKAGKALGKMNVHVSV
jgi:NADPH:quinone reductase